MKGKQLFFLIVLAALAGGGWYYLAGRNLGISPTARAGGKVVEFPINEVAQIKIKSSGGEVNVIKKGDTWVVKERNDYPANFEQVSGLVRKVWELKPGQDVKVGPSQMPRLELGEPGKGDKAGTLVEMLGADGKTLAGLLLGKKQERKGRGDDMGMAGADGFPMGRYIKPVEGTQVSLVAELFDDAEPKPERWISKEFVKIEGPKAIFVTGQTDAQKWTVTRESAAGEWKLIDAKPDEKVDSNKTSPLGMIFTSPNVNDLVGPEAKAEDTGLDKPTVAKIETFDGFMYELKIGKASGSNIPVVVNVSANLPKERTPGKDEKPEDKARLDDEFKARQKKLEEKLANEQKFNGRAFLVSSFTVDALLKDRSALLADKPAEAERPAEPAPAPGAPAPLPVPAPGAATPAPAPGTPPPALPAPAPKPDAAPPASAPSPSTPPAPAPAAPVPGTPTPKPDAPTPPAPPAPAPDAAPSTPPPAPPAPAPASPAPPTPPTPAPAPPGDAPVPKPDAATPPATPPPAAPAPAPAPTPEAAPPAPPSAPAPSPAPPAPDAPKPPASPSEQP